MQPLGSQWYVSLWGFTVPGSVAMAVIEHIKENKGRRKEDDLGDEWGLYIESAARLESRTKELKRETVFIR